MSDRSTEHRLATRAIRAGQHLDQFTGAVAPPIYQSSTFALADLEQALARVEVSAPVGSTGR